MRKRILAFTVVLAMGCTVLLGGNQRYLAQGATKAPTPTSPKLSVPDYAKLDKDLLKDAAAAGKKLTGKKLVGYNGNAYSKPDALNGLKAKDVRGTQKGIAIMVDFPVSQGKTSDVPGVDYAQVPKEQFNDLLNGTYYNPYSLGLFNWLENYKDPDTGVITKAATDRTMKNYYNEASYNQFQIDVDVVGWYTLPYSYDYYLGQNKGYYNDNGDAFIGELISDAIDLADKAGVDFSQYATAAKAGDFKDLYGDATSFVDGNGNLVNKIVPNIFIIHRGTGAEYSADPSIIWSHQWDILSANYYGKYYQTGSYPADSTLKYKIVDGVVANAYDICPEVGQDITEYYTKPNGLEKRLPSPADVGVFAHEFGHVLGLPDQYDYGYESEGTGMFTLMASGSYGRDIQNRYYSGFCPVELDAWSRYYLGFMEPEVILPTNGITKVTINPANASKEAYKIEVPGSNGREYFLLENRQQKGFDAGLEYNKDGKALHGLVVYHIDEDVLVRNFDRPNEAANWDWNNRGANYKDKETGENHYGISVVQADGNWDMEKGNNDGDAGDVFPGKGKVIKLSPYAKSTPNTLSYYIWGINNRSYTGITINNIKESSKGVITADIYFQK